MLLVVPYCGSTVYFTSFVFLDRVAAAQRMWLLMPTKDSQGFDLKLNIQVQILEPVIMVAKLN